VTSPVTVNGVNEVSSLKIASTMPNEKQNPESLSERFSIRQHCPDARKIGATGTSPLVICQMLANAFRHTIPPYWEIRRLRRLLRDYLRVVLGMQLASEPRSEAAVGTGHRRISKPTSTERLSVE
jgi:hypothetical protein